MSLTYGRSPLARPPGGRFNFDLEQVAPEHILYLDDEPKRIRAVLAGETILDSRRAKMLHETGRFPQRFFPLEDVVAESLLPSERRRSDRFKGEGVFYDLRVGERRVSDAGIRYEPPPGGVPIGGMIAFKFDKLDQWLEEDEPIRGHPRDPYHRFDCRRTGEHVVVQIGDETVADTRRAIKLFETSTVTRYYVPLDEVRPGCLTPSSTRSWCPYKGEAAYFDVRAGSRLIEDGAWTLPEPLGEAVVVLGHISFWKDETRLFADGRPQPL